MRKATADKNRDPSEFQNIDGGREQLFLVKVPKYLSEAWVSAAKGNGIADVGSLLMSTHKCNDALGGNSFEASYLPSKSLLAASKDELPLKHKVHLIRQQEQFDKPYIYSTTAEGEFPELIGQVEFKGDIKADIDDPRYVNLKRRAVITANTPARTIQVLETHHRAYKPKTNSMNMSMLNPTGVAQRTAGPELRRERADKQVVIEVVLAAFQERQNYNIKELTTLTEQPIQYLKEILGEICVYNTRNPNKFTFELKPEYRHY